MSGRSVYLGGLVVGRRIHLHAVGVCRRVCWRINRERTGEWEAPLVLGVQLDVDRGPLQPSTRQCHRCRLQQQQRRIAKVGRDLKFMCQNKSFITSATTGQFYTRRACINSINSVASKGRVVRVSDASFHKRWSSVDVGCGCVCVNESRVLTRCLHFTGCDKGQACKVK